MSNGKIKVGDIFKIGDSLFVITSLCACGQYANCVVFERDESVLYERVVLKELYKKDFICNIFEK